ncbi:YopX family protein [Enterococcus hirae]|uniref:YopX family protein n=1 Tax=Enterococcus hirae TaxID=1354 RepID=UPI00137885C5|nr:YopX family protein [Enterococcus hirae]NBA55054.1 hypothetical protein [Enterococcus hirae]
MIPKFRAWYTPFKGEKFGQEMKYGQAGSLITHAEMAPDKYVLMQSTGLKDKNSVEIFEGDVVVVENHPFQRKEDSGVGMEIEGNYVVGWNQHDLTWCAGDLLLARLKPYVKVIGNIYENPELLEEEMR